MPLDPVHGIEIGLAGAGDIDGIAALLRANEAAEGGALTASFPRRWIARALADMPVVVAKRDERVVGVLLTSSRAAGAGTPVVRAMLEAYPGAAGAYVYGPIAVDVAERGKGIANAMFERLKRRLPGREGILFIRRDNAASLKAHAKMGIRTVTEFSHQGTAFVVLSYVG